MRANHKLGCIFNTTIQREIKTKQIQQISPILHNYLIIILNQFTSLSSYIIQSACGPQAYASPCKNHFRVPNYSSDARYINLKKNFNHQLCITEEYSFAITASQWNTFVRCTLHGICMYYTHIYIYMYVLMTMTSTKPDPERYIYIVPFVLAYYMRLSIRLPR